MNSLSAIVRLRSRMTWTAPKYFCTPRSSIWVNAALPNRPSVPDLLPEQDWLALEDGKRAAHDEERLEHHSRLVVVLTPVIGRIVTQGGNLIRMNRLAHYGRSGLMVSGPPRTGKTTAVTQLGKTVEVTRRHRNPARSA